MVCENIHRKHNNIVVRCDSLFIDERKKNELSFLSVFVAIVISCLFICLFVNLFCSPKSYNYLNPLISVALAFAFRLFLTSKYTQPKKNNFIFIYFYSSVIILPSLLFPLFSKTLYLSTNCNCELQRNVVGFKHSCRTNS